MCEFLLLVLSLIGTDMDRLRQKRRYVGVLGLEVVNSLCGMESGEQKGCAS